MKAVAAMRWARRVRDSGKEGRTQLAHSQGLVLETLVNFQEIGKGLGDIFQVSSWLCTADSLSSLPSCNLLKWGTAKAPSDVAAATAWEILSEGLP